MTKLVNLFKLREILKNKKYENIIKLEVDGKFLGDTNYLQIKRLVVPKELLKELGMKETKISGGKKDKPQRESKIDKLTKLVTQGFIEIRSDLDNIKQDVSELKSNQKLMMNTPTMKRELKKLL